jgi:transposase-like protein
MKTVYTSAFKAQVVLELLKEEKSLSQLAGEYKIHPYQPSPPSAQEAAAKHRIDELYLEFPYYGARRMAAQLRREGQALDRKTARKYMQEMGLIALYPGPNLSKRHNEHRVFP